MAEDTKIESQGNDVVPVDSPHGPEWEVIPEGQESKFLEDVDKIIKGEEIDDTSPDPTEPVPSEQPKPTEKPPEKDSLLSRLKGETEDTKDKTKELEKPDDTIPEYKKGSTAEQWKEVHTRKNDAIKRAVAAENELKDIKGKTTEESSQRLVDSENKIQELNNELERVAIERSPKFQKEFNEKRNSIMDGIKGLVGSDFDKVEKLLNSNSATRTNQLEGVWQDLSPLRQSAFANAVSSFDQLDADYKLKVNQSLQNWEEDRNKESGKREVQVKEARNSFSKISNVYKEKYTETDDPIWNKRIETTLGNLSQKLDKEFSADEFSHSQIRGALFDDVIDLAVRQQETISKLQSQVGKFKGSTPDPSGASIDSTEEGESDVTKEIERHGDVGQALAHGAMKQGFRLG